MFAMVKTLLCGMCADTGILCSSCQRKIGCGELSETDVKLSLFLAKCLPESPVVVGKALDFGNYLLLITPSDPTQLIGRKGATAAKISREMGKPVKIVTTRDDFNSVVQNLMHPCRITAINTLMSKGGDLLKVRVAASELRKLPIDITTLEKTVFELTRKKAKLVVE